MISEERTYEKFIDELHTHYPRMYSQLYGGVCTGPGWWPIISKLSYLIKEHIVNRGKQQNWCVENGRTPPESIEPVVVSQIKEKFGGLRFYYDGGDEYISGLVAMAEMWAENTCELCGSPGKKVDNRGWLQTLCDTHVKE